MVRTGHTLCLLWAHFPNFPNKFTWLTCVEEMAHYACDCWDAELLTSYGWIECVGCADRSAYDLSVHSKFTGADLKVKESLHTGAIRTELWEATLDKKLAGQRFKKDARIVQASIGAMDQSTLQRLAEELDNHGVVTVDTLTTLADGTSSVSLPRDQLTTKKTTRVQTTREYTPNVIEPSFGIGRILYSLLEHVYWNRLRDSARAVSHNIPILDWFFPANRSFFLSAMSQPLLHDYVRLFFLLFSCSRQKTSTKQVFEVLSLPLAVAPTKVLIVPISAQPQFSPITNKLSARLRKLGISNNVDSSGASIGKRYARNDELGTPLGITVDFDTVANGSLTLRERDSTSQVRGSEDDVIMAIKRMVDGVETWGDVALRLPSFTAHGHED